MIIINYILIFLIFKIILTLAKQRQERKRTFAPPKVGYPKSEAIISAQSDYTHKYLYIDRKMTFGSESDQIRSDLDSSSSDGGEGTGDSSDRSTGWRGGAGLSFGGWRIASIIGGIWRIGSTPTSTDASGSFGTGGSIGASS